MIDQIKRFKFAQPFEPFEIELSSGSVWRIKAPDFVIVGEFGQGRIAVLNEDRTFSTVSGLQWFAWELPGLPKNLSTELVTRPHPRRSGLAHRGSICAYLRFKHFVRVHSCPFAVCLSRLRPRMCLVVRFLQPFDRNMSINLRGRKALMTKQGLNAAEVGAVLQKMGRKAMPKLVRSCRQLDRGFA
jgi:hypothetical protein